MQSALPFIFLECEDASLLENEADLLLDQSPIMRKVHCHGVCWSFSPKEDFSLPYFPHAVEKRPSGSPTEEK
jgi:hypothetical protein